MINKNMLEDSKDPYVQADIEALAQDATIPWGVFHGKVILVTGATGLIGSQTIKAIICHNRLFNANIGVLALARNIEKAQKIFANIINRSELTIVKSEITNELMIAEKADYIIHGASATSSKDFVNKPVETIKTTIQGTLNILDYAKNCNIKGIVYLSSLEYYGIPTNGTTNITENDLGYIDPQQVRSSYSEGKRLAETLCQSYYHEYNLPISIARLAQTFGPGISAEDNRVFAQFARSIIKKENIVLKTKGETIRNYCSTYDAIKGILLILAKGARGEAYNIANHDTTISIVDMAKMLCSTFGENNSKVVFDLSENPSKLGFNPTVKISLNSQKLSNLGWIPKFNLQQMFAKTINSLKVKMNQDVLN